MIGARYTAIVFKGLHYLVYAWSEMPVYCGKLTAPADLGELITWDKTQCDPSSSLESKHILALSQHARVCEKCEEGKKSTCFGERSM